MRKLHIGICLLFLILNSFSYASLNCRAEFKSRDAILRELVDLKVEIENLSTGAQAGDTTSRPMAQVLDNEFNRKAQAAFNSGLFTKAQFEQAFQLARLQNSVTSATRANLDENSRRAEEVNLLAIRPFVEKRHFNATTGTSLKEILIFDHEDKVSAVTIANELLTFDLATNSAPKPIFSTDLGLTTVDHVLLSQTQSNSAWGMEASKGRFVKLDFLNNSVIETQILKEHVWPDKIKVNSDQSRMIVRENSELRVIDLTQRRFLADVIFSVNGFSFSPDGTHIIAITTARRKVAIYRSHDLSLVCEIQALQLGSSFIAIQSAALSGDNSRLVVADANGDISVYNVFNPKIPLAEFESPENKPVYDLAFHSDNRAFLAAYTSGTKGPPGTKGLLKEIIFWNIEEKSQIQKSHYLTNQQNYHLASPEKRSQLRQLSERFTFMSLDKFLGFLFILALSFLSQTSSAITTAQCTAEFKTKTQILGELVSLKVEIENLTAHAQTGDSMARSLALTLTGELNVKLQAALVAGLFSPAEFGNGVDRARTVSISNQRTNAGLENNLRQNELSELNFAEIAKVDVFENESIDQVKLFPGSLRLLAGSNELKQIASVTWRNFKKKKVWGFADKFVGGGNIHATALTSDGQFIATLFENGKAVFTDTKTQVRTEPIIKYPRNFTSLAVRPDLSEVLFGAYQRGIGGALVLLDPTSGEEKTTIDFPESSVEVLSFAKTPSIAFLTQYELNRRWSQIAIWNLTTKKLVKRFISPKEGYISGHSKSPSDSYVGFQTQDIYVVFDTNVESQAKYQLQLNGQLVHVASFSNDESLLFLAGADSTQEWGKISVWSMADGQKLFDLDFSSPVSSIDVLDNKTVAVGLNDGTVRILKRGLN